MGVLVPSEAQYKPEGHILQSSNADFPVESLYLPAGHFLWAVVDTGQYEPVGHIIGFSVPIGQ